VSPDATLVAIYVDCEAVRSRNGSMGAVKRQSIGVNPGARLDSRAMLTDPVTSLKNLWAYAEGCAIVGPSQLARSVKGSAPLN
jgi:hypothetical protein